MMTATVAAPVSPLAEAGRAAVIKHLQVVGLAPLVRHEQVPDLGGASQDDVSAIVTDAL